MKLALGLLATVALATPTYATSFHKYCEHRVADSENNYYFVVKRNDPEPDNRSFAGPVSITIVQRKAGSEPVPDMKAAEDSLPTAQNCVDPKICVRGSDVIHGQISLESPPAKILIRKDGKGIVTVDLYGFNAGDDPALAVTSYSPQGKLLNRHSREPIIKLMDVIHRGDGVVSWYSHMWIDDKRDELVFV